MSSLIRVNPNAAEHRVIVARTPACTNNGTSRVYAGGKKINIMSGRPNTGNVYAG